MRSSPHCPPHKRSLQVVLLARKAQASFQIHPLTNSPAMGRAATEAAHGSRRGQPIHISTINFAKQFKDQHQWVSTGIKSGNLLSMSYCSETEPRWKTAEEETLAVVQHLHGIRAPIQREFLY